MINVRGQELYVDFVTELSEFEWTNETWTSTRLIANSPFREESRPSFFVDLESGGWADSGSFDFTRSSGNFVKLLSLLRYESIEETEDYLLEMYGESKRRREFVIPPSFYETTGKKPMPDDSMTVATSVYLLRRGVQVETQRLYGVGKGRHKGHTAIPWRLPDGSIGTIMYRSTKGKRFYYEKTDYSRGELVYGIDVVRKEKAITAALCEAPIDALTWHSATNGSIVGIAVGGTSLSQEQADIIYRSGIRKLIVAGDNDAAGRSFNDRVMKSMRGKIIVEPYSYAPFKDANEAIEKIKKEFENNA